MIIDEDKDLIHYGTPRKSGRYPWGSGGDIVTVPTRNKDFIDLVSEMRAQGLTDTQIAETMAMSTTDFRARNSIAKNAHRQEQIREACNLKFEKGMSNVAAAAQMGIPESTFRNLTADGAADKADIITTTSDMLRRQVAEKKYVDIGVGVETQLNMSQERLKTSVAVLTQEGYVTENIPVKQLGTNKETRVKVLAPPGTTWGEIVKNKEQIRQIQEWSDDGGRSFIKVQTPLAINPKRIQVVYGAAGAKNDGVIYVRPDVEDLSLGGNSYGQVRIQVGNTHYMKGMAVRKDDLPDGVDLVYHTPKSNTGNPLDAMKPLKTDLTGKTSEDLPFGSVVRQLTDAKGKVTSVMNLMGTKETSGIEGGWDTWSSTLSAQLLSKQSPTLAKKQLEIVQQRKQKDFEDIMALTNPVVKKRMLQDFADGVDSAAVNLKAAALPRQATRVILPINSLKDKEVYAPGFRDGEPVVLVRYPHAGTFEIPELVVNNKNREGRKLLGDVKDAIGINANVAQHLSGADFDGDTVIVIPNSGRQRIKHTTPLAGLKDFDPRTAYPAHEGMKPMSAKTKGTEMGKVSNLITDMTIRQAPHSEIVRAVRHSMAVIDAEKHPIDWHASYRINGIKALSDKYQKPFRDTGLAGASTLISRAGSRKDLPHREPRKMRDGGPIDKKTGEKVFVPTGKTTRTAKGEKPAMETHDLLSVTKDARTLSSGTPIESLYASHSNRLKALANQARLESLRTPTVKVNSSSKKVYAAEVASLNAKLQIAKANAPRERQAQIVGGSLLKATTQANPDMEYSTKKKLKYQILETARARTGAKKTQIVITDKEWDAIQNGAISTHQLDQILSNADPDRIQALATPRTAKLMTAAKTTKAQTLLAAGLTRAEVADRLGVSISTLDAATS